MAISGSSVPHVLVRLGHLEFEDFEQLPDEALVHVSARPDARHLLGKALSSMPVLLHRFRHVCPDIIPVGASRDESVSAQHMLVRMFALELLREIAPPLYDALPWNSWETDVLARRYRLWRTRVLLHGEHVPHTAAKLPRTAGLYVAEPSAAVRGYVERKCRLERIKHLRTLDCGLDSIALPDRSVDLAVVGPSLGTDPARTFSELNRVASDIILLLLRPGSEEDVDESWLTERGFTPGQVSVVGDTRPGWWRLSTNLTEPA